MYSIAASVVRFEIGSCCSWCLRVGDFYVQFFNTIKIWDVRQAFAVVKMIIAIVKVIISCRREPEQSLQHKHQFTNDHSIVRSSSTVELRKLDT